MSVNSTLSSTSTKKSFFQYFTLRKTSSESVDISNYHKALDKAVRKPWFCYYKKPTSQVNSVVPTTHVEPVKPSDVQPVEVPNTDSLVVAESVPDTLHCSPSSVKTGKRCVPGFNKDKKVPLNSVTPNESSTQTKSSTQTSCLPYDVTKKNNVKSKTKTVCWSESVPVPTNPESQMNLSVREAATVPGEVLDQENPTPAVIEVSL